MSVMQFAPTAHADRLFRFLDQQRMVVIRSFSGNAQKQKLEQLELARASVQALLEYSKKSGGGV